METLDGLEHKFDTEMLMICDIAVPHDIAGVMGGMHSSVTEDTTDLLLECALFEPKSIRRTCRALGISTGRELPVRAGRGSGRASSGDQARVGGHPRQRGR